MPYVDGHYPNGRLLLTTGEISAGFLAAVFDDPHLTRRVAGVILKSRLADASRREQDGAPLGELDRSLRWDILSGCPRLDEERTLVDVLDLGADATGEHLRALFPYVLERSNDDAYLRQSIIDPRSQVVQNYANIMPTTYSSLSKADVDDLIAYLRELSSHTR